MTLTQMEADTLFGMPKEFRSAPSLEVGAGVDVAHELDSMDRSESFILDVRVNRLRLVKYRYQNRGRRVYILARLCINGPPHTNPDGVRLGTTHLHRYREGYEDKFADPIDPSIFADISDRAATLRAFCTLCSINTVPPIFDSGTLVL